MGHSAGTPKIKDVQKTQLKNIITTEKDLVKFPKHFLEKFNIYIVKITIQFENDFDIFNILKTVF